MSTEHSQHPCNPPSDPIVDEVRAIRRSICDEFGNDVDRLCDHLQEVEREYRERTGRFAGLLNLTNEQVIESWGDEAWRTDDPLIDEVREIRRGLTERP